MLAMTNHHASKMTTNFIRVVYDIFSWLKFGGILINSLLISITCTTAVISFYVKGIWINSKTWILKSDECSPFISCVINRNSGSPF